MRTEREPTESEMRTEVWRNAMRICDTSDDSDDDTRAAAMLLASGIVGPDEDAIAKLLAMPRSDFEHLAAEAWRNGIWADGKVRGSHWYDEDGGLALLMDVCVCKGFLERTT